MTSKAEKKRMLEYLVENLKGSETDIIPQKSELVSGIMSSYIFLGDHNALLLGDQNYPGDSFELAHSHLKCQRQRTTAVLYKDGKTFFRNASHSNSFKQRYSLSLKEYTSEQVNRMIQMRPEELFLTRIKDYIQYYQPKSDRLNEGIITFKFRTVKFDYSHLNHFARTGYELENKDSKRIMIQEKVSERSGSLKFEEIFPSQYPKAGITKSYPFYLVKAD